MISKVDKLKEFDFVLNKFARFIRLNIQKFDLPKSGIDPEDVIQEIRIKIWNILNDEKKIIHYSSYIKKIVDSSVIDHLRRMRRERGLLQIEKQKIAEWKQSYEREIPYDGNLMNIIHDAVESLIESRRKVVKLYLLNLTINEISIFYDWSKDKTRNLLYRGLADLRKILREKGIKYEAKK